MIPIYIIIFSKKITMSSHIIIDSGKTPSAEYIDRIFVKNNKIIQEKYGYRLFNDIREIQWTIHDLVVNRGFAMNHSYNGRIELDNPHFNIIYIIWPKSLEIETIYKNVVGHLK